MNARLLTVFFFALCACGGLQECKLDDATTCTGGLVCEKLEDSKVKVTAVCFQPVMVQGTVKELGAVVATPVSKAEVLVLDANGAPLAPAATTDTDGSFSVRIPTTRSDSKLGTLVGRSITLRASAQDHLSFPSILRPATTLDTGSAKEVSGKPYALSTGTDLTLIALSDAEKGRPAVSGTVELPDGKGLIVALEGNGRGYVTVPDSTGAFHLFNVIAGAGYKAQAYAKGLNYVAATVDVVSGTDSTGVQVKKSTATTTFTAMTGSVQLSTGSNGAGTSVELVLESTFDNVLARGEPIPGLRAPESGTPNLSGSYSIDGIPDGKYVALVGFDNDGNVRDPDPSIASSQLTHVTVTNGTPSANPVLKVVGAVQVVSPGAGDALEEIAGVPTFKWKPYATATGYTLGVYTVQGVKTWERLAVLTATDADGNIAVPYGGTTPLKTGVLYQWRVTAYNLLNPISFTEDVRGLFVVK
jgi:hypothetical protein